MKHLIIIETPEHGVLSVQHAGRDSQYSEAGETIILDWQPDPKWGLQEAHYTDEGGNVTAIDLTPQTIEGREVVAFTMPDSAITIGATFKRFVIEDWTEGTNPSEGAVLVVGNNGEPLPVPVDDLANQIAEGDNEINGFAVNNNINTRLDIYKDLSMCTVPLTRNGICLFPYVFSTENGTTITEMTFKVSSAGPLDIFATPKSVYDSIVYGTTAASSIISNSNLITQLDIQQAGVVTLETNITIPANCLLMFRIPSDNGAQPTAYIQTGSGNSNQNLIIANEEGGLSVSQYRGQIGLSIVFSNNVKTYTHNISRQFIKSIYDSKRFGILGDSISSYDFFTSVGYYPWIGNDVASIEDTWWSKVLYALNGVLDTNNSWSGSTVSTGGDDATAAAVNDARCLSFTNPDVIIFNMGINDFVQGVGIGTWNGTTALPTSTATFREAYAITLKKMQTAYPRAEIWCCTQMPITIPTDYPITYNGQASTLKEFNDAIIEIAGIMGCGIIDLYSICNLQRLNLMFVENHPNIYGMNLMANKVVNTLDGAIGIRF